MSTEILPPTRSWCQRWGINLLDEIPHPGLATKVDVRRLTTAMRRWPGRNHPRSGLWLIKRYASPGTRCADPMYGVGALWMLDDTVALETAEIEKEGPGSGDARFWKPRQPCGLTMFSPPFLQNHSAGGTQHQKDIREAHGFHSMQEFGAAPGNLARMKIDEFWPSMSDVYRQVMTYTTGRMVVILRNMIRNGMVVDHVGQHIRLMQAAGWVPIGAHPRSLRPTGYVQWKVAKDPDHPWIKTEWAVVCWNPTGEVSR